MNITVYWAKLAACVVTGACVWGVACYNIPLAIGCIAALEADTYFELKRKG